MKFNIDENVIEVTEEGRILKNGRELTDADCTQTFVARVNKGIRDGNPFPRVKLNVGCGHRPFQDSINLDYDETCYPDVIRDLKEGLPFDSDKFEEVYSSHVIEHVQDVFFFMYEIWRVSKNGAKVRIIAPYCGHLEWAIQPDHVRMINWGFFDRWRKDWKSVQTETKQTRNAFFNILSTQLINESREITFLLEVVK